MSAPELHHSFKAVMATSLHWERDWSYSQPRMPYIPKHLWCSDHCSLCREGLCGLKNACWHLQHCSSPRSHGPSVTGGLIHTAGQKSSASSLSLLALLKGQERHSPAFVGTHSFPAQPVSVHRGKQWNEGRSKGDLRQIRLFRGEL